jgi:glycosyltransferase involved in cell wall biosynthesis
MKILGVSPAVLTGWQDPASPNKWAPFFRALDAHAEVIDVVRPLVPRSRQAAQLARRASGRLLPVGLPWSDRGFRARTRVLERALQPYEGRYDLLFQLQTLHGPGTRSRPYAICTDSTHALYERHDPAARRLPRERARRWQALEAEVARRARYVFTWSEFARRSFIEDYGCHPQRVIASGAGANMVLDELPDRSALPPRALFVGYEFERKGGLALLEAWAEVERRVPGAELVIAGPKVPLPSAARNVTWVGRADRATLGRLYREATLFVLPSLFEPFGLVFLEAMGHGLPVVASDCCAMPEIVREAETGALVPRGDAAALAETLTGLLADPDRAARMGRAGHEAVLSHHTWAHVGERMARPLLMVHAAHRAPAEEAAVVAAPRRLAAAG